METRKKSHLLSIFSWNSVFVDFLSEGSCASVCVCKTHVFSRSIAWAFCIVLVHNFNRCLDLPWHVPLFHCRKHLGSLTISILQFILKWTFNLRMSSFCLLGYSSLRSIHFVYLLSLFLECLFCFIEIVLLQLFDVPFLS